MFRIFFRFALVITLAAVAVSAQTVRGQFLLPNGSPPNEPIRFTLTSMDGRMNDIQYSDSNGRFILPRLGATVDHIITVDGDGVNYGNTSYQFNSGYSAPTRITLNRPPRRKSAPEGTISAASGYRPKAGAVKLHEAALKDIQKQDVDAAEKKLRKAIAIDSQFLAPLNDLGVLLMQQGRYRNAEGALRKAVEADSKSFLALLNLGTTLNRLGKHAEAIPYLSETLRLEPRMVAGHLELGIAQVETDQFAEAEQHLQRVLRSPGVEEIPALLFIGKLYARTGNFPRGVSSLELYLRKAPRARNAGDVRALVDRMKSEMARRA